GGGVMRKEEGKELTAEEVVEAVARLQAAVQAPTPLRPGLPADAGPAGDALAASRSAADPLPPNTSILPKSVLEAEDPTDDLAGREVRVVKAQRGDTLARVLQRLGAETWQARAMTDAARNPLPPAAPQPGPALHR